MITAAAAQSDESLVRAAQGGDAAAFEQLIHRHAGLVHTIARARMGDRETAEDLTQEVFLRVHLNLHRLTDPSLLGPWLVRLTRNLAVDWLRRGLRRSQLVPLVPLDASAQQVPDTRIQGAREIMESHDQSAALRTAIDRLPPELRELVLLHFAEGIRQREIAERMGLPAYQVSRQIKRAIRALRGLVVPALREAAPALRTPPVVATKTVALIAALGAMSATSKAALAAKATEGASVLTQAPAAAAGLWATLKASIITGGSVMATGKGIVATVTAVAAVGGLIAFSSARSKSPVPEGPAEQAAQVSAAAAVELSGPVTLWLTLPVGSEWTERTQLFTTARRTFSGGGMPQPQSSLLEGTRRIVTDHRVTGGNPSGTRIEWTIRDASESLTQDGAPVPLGQANWEDPARMIGQRHYDVLTGSGYLSQSDVPGGGAIDIFRSEMRPLLAWPVFMLPDHPVRPGESWSQSPLAPDVRALRMNVTGTLERIDDIGGRRVATIRSVLTQTLTEPLPDSGGSMDRAQGRRITTESLDARIDAVGHFDIDHGQWISQSGSGELTSRMSFTERGGAQLNADMRLTLQVQTDWDRP